MPAYLACAPIRALAASLRALLLVSSALLAPCAFAQADALRQQVFAAERAFARSMSDRDAAAFARFISEEAIFFTGPEPYRGRQQVVQGWAPFFEGKPAPFSWQPDQVEVLASGTLALSTGLVRNPEGQVIGRFNSIWRLEDGGTWRVVFDKGSPPTVNDKR